jgi:hypothetical protein
MTTGPSTEAAAERRTTAVVLTAIYGVISTALFVIPAVLIGGPDQYCHAAPALAEALLYVSWVNCG